LGTLIEREGEMIDPEMSGRLGVQVFSAALKGFHPRDLATRLRQGERVPFYLPHSSGPDDKVEIGGAFFAEAESPIREVESILAALMATARPFCEGWVFELDVRSPERVAWRARDWSDKREIRGGPEPLDQALAKMSRLGREEGHEEGRKEKRPKSMLPLVGILEERLPDWEVSFLRSCCLSLRKRREDIVCAIDLSLVPEDAVLASASVRASTNSVGKIVKRGGREDILSFILEVAEEINELAELLSKLATAQHGQVLVVIAPPDLPPDKFLSERRLPEI